MLLAASAAPDTADGRRLLLPLLLANAGCIPVLCLAPGGVCAWPLPACCGVLPLPVARDAGCGLLPCPAAARCPAGLPLLLAALLGEEPWKGSVCGSCALVTKGCLRRRTALARCCATLQAAIGGHSTAQQG